MAKVLKAHAMNGAVKVQAYAESPEVFDPDQTLWIEDERGDGRMLTVFQSRPGPRNWIVAFHEIKDRTAAEALAGRHLYTEKAALPAIEEDTYYWVDLIGMRVRTVERRDLGMLEHILRTGSNDVFVVRKGERETLVPALASVVVSVDIEGGELVVDLPEGL